ncbi:MAG TPA: PEGA domain-containing protein [Gemmataceae bacterium]|nr:PEGA domain-containing protein [Gemmataceae bacterium]
MKRNACLAMLLTVSLTAGCVERRFVVNSDPPGALVYHNGIYLGATPVDGYITFYGKQQFRLIKEGYQTLDVVQEYYPPWYEWPGIDFVTENINPFKVRDVRSLHYTMQPMQTVRPDDVRQQAEQLREQGRNIGVPAAPRPIAPGPPAPPPPQGAVLEGPAPSGAPTLPPPRPATDLPPG